jgi:hypothetical protein
VGDERRIGSTIDIGAHDAERRAERGTEVDRVDRG